ncbi:Vinorine synthase [Morella rubra]|uniref:Vinorine synthase n=2 Tax=Morella rubra TaxID=262757 RepID=A0A6A1WFD0_9ROSI|nr:Vinorine synthase [Morella rubra]
MNMEVDVLSREIIRPSSPAVLRLKPFKLTLLDQITPTTYGPLVLFYPKSHTNRSKGLQILPAQLKKSLSKTLDHFYPFSGRTQRNLFIDHYDEGVPYYEARVNCRMHDFLQNPETEALNHFLPCCPFSKEPNPEEAAQVAVQVNIFDCGGIAIGVCMSHKITDGSTMSVFFKSWAAAAAGHCNKLTLPDFSGSSRSSARFPPQDRLLTPIHLSIMESLWFKEAKYKTRRFVMGKKSIATLRAKAKTCEYNPMDKEMEFCGMVEAIKESVEKINSDYLRNVEGDKGLSAIRGQLYPMAPLVLFSKAEIFAFTSWLTFGLEDLDFGWGKPIWVGAMGGVGPAFRELIIFTKSNGVNAIEAWVTLKEKEMAVLEDDPEFLAFAAKNPCILIS